MHYVCYYRCHNVSQKIYKPLVFYRFYCMALFHSQTQPHMINGAIGGENKNRQNMRPPNTVFKLSYTISYKWTHILSMVVSNMSKSQTKLNGRVCQRRGKHILKGATFKGKYTLKSSYGYYENRQ